MKRLFFPLILALLLTGCAVDAGPNQAVQDTEPSNQTAIIADPTQTASQENGDAYLAFIPDIPAGYEEHELVNGLYESQEADLDVLKAYCDQLFEFGYHEVSYEIDYSREHHDYFYWEKQYINSNEDVVILIYEEMHLFQDFEIRSTGEILINPDPSRNYRSGEITENLSIWEDHEYRAMVPAPPTTHWRGQIGGGENGEHYSVYMEHLKTDQAKQYADAMINAGFNCRVYEGQMPVNGYTFSAYNADGWWVWLTNINGSGDNEYYTALFIAKPGIDSYNDWADPGVGLPIMEPPVDWHIQSFLYADCVELAEMDYAAVQDYVRNIEASFSTSGPGTECVNTIYEKNDENQSIYYSTQLRVWNDQTNFSQSTLILTYDSNQADSPCKMYILKLIS